MAVSDIDAVLEFLKKNGFSQSESALMDDIVEKSQFQTLDYEKFMFPMVPPPPLLKIPAAHSHRSPEGTGVACDNSTADSSDEFVSLGSSKTNFTSSEFVNPYGLCSTTRVSSQASSDRLSQFGTARDYPDFDIQNDLYWFNDHEESALTSSLGKLDSFLCPTEDKFIMTSEVENNVHNTLYPPGDTSEDIQSTETSHQLKKNWPFNVSSMDDLKEYQFFDDFKIDGNLQHETGSEKEDHSLYRCSAPLCACCAEPEGLFRGDLKEDDEKHACCDFSLKNSTSESGKKLKGDGNFGVQMPEKDSNYGHGFNDDEPEPAAHVEEGTTEEELQIYDTNKEEYEIFNLRVIHRKNRTGFEENKELPIVMNSVIAGRYYVTEYLGSAAFSRVVQAQDLLTGVDVCLKIIKNDKDFFDQSLDEIKLLRYVNKHDPGDEYHILRLYDYFYFQEHLFIVCELLRANLYEFQKFNRESDGEPYFTMNRLQLIARQCLEALVFLHQLDIIHCDLKPENILIKSYRRCEIKVIDLGSSCFVTDNVCMYVQSRSYRAPEVILGLPYDQKIDIWSLGCILAELYSGEVLFPNEAVAMLLGRMIGVLGPIDSVMLVNEQETQKYFTKEFDLYQLNEETNELEYIIPEESSLEDHLMISDAGFSDFLRDLLEINPERRLTSKDALQHPWLSYQYDHILYS